MSRPEHVRYALYKGDEYLGEGTASELAEMRGVRRETIWYLASPHSKRKDKGNRAVAVRLEECVMFGVQPESKAFVEWDKCAANVIADEVEREQQESYERGRRDVQADGKAKCVRHLAEATGKGFEPGESITEWLARYYMELPCYPDGEPVSKGCKVESGTVELFSIHSDGSWNLFDEDGLIIESGDAGDAVKRPEPPVVDADGVPYEQGDKVWALATGIALTVAQVSTKGPKGPCFIAEEYPGLFDANAFTHREPDSLEKSMENLSLLIDELDESVEGGHPLARRFCEVYDRLTDLMERGA